MTTLVRHIVLGIRLLLAIWPAAVSGEEPVPKDYPGIPTGPPYDQSTAIGPHHRWHEYVQDVLDETGRSISVTNRYVQIETGLNYLDAGEWKESRAEIELFPGGAVAQKGRHKVIFANNLATPGSIDLETPDGKRLRSHVLLSLA